MTNTNPTLVVSFVFIILPVAIFFIRDLLTLRKIKRQHKQQLDEIKQRMDEIMRRNKS